MAEEERILEVTPDFDGKRIDQCLAASFRTVPVLFCRSF